MQSALDISSAVLQFARDNLRTAHSVGRTLGGALLWVKRFFRSAVLLRLFSG
jgi:hypothetical protein